MTRCGSSSKGNNRANTSSLSTSKRVLGLGEDLKAPRQSESLDYAVMNTASVGISAF